MKKRKKTVIIILILCILLIIFIMNSIKYDFLQEDLLLFQLFSSAKQTSEELNISKLESNANNEIANIESSASIKKESSKTQNPNQTQFIFDVEYKNTKLTDINLLDTVDNKTLVYEKIAPGTSGGFDIVLKSNQQINYKIEFESKNAKPVNLQFYTLDNLQKYNTLEELGENLEGSISKNEEKTIHIFWEWSYETNKDANIQDTIDANNIREYNFLIYVRGF